MWHSQPATSFPEVKIPLSARYSRGKSRTLRVVVRGDKQKEGSEDDEWRGPGVVAWGNTSHLY